MFLKEQKNVLSCNKALQNFSQLKGIHYAKLKIMK